MRWLTSDAFWTHWNECVEIPTIDYLGWCMFFISEAELRDRIRGVEPNDHPDDEGDQPGPVLRWYGDLGGVPVLVDFHAYHPDGPAVLIRHGAAAGARASVRKYFCGWGGRWLESKPA